MNQIKIMIAITLITISCTTPPKKAPVVQQRETEPLKLATRAPRIKINKNDKVYLSGVTTLDKTKKQQANFRLEIIGYDRSRYPEEMKIFVISKDANGNFVSNLAEPYSESKTTYKKYFLELTEEFESQSNGKTVIKDFQVREYHDKNTQPYSSTLVLDHSGSMMPPTVMELQQSVSAFINNKNENDEISVIQFDHRIQTTIPLLKKKETILNHPGFNNVTIYGGGTALYAAANQGIKNLAHSKNRKVLLLFTDGYDNSSLLYFTSHAFDPASLVRIARENDVRIIAVGYGHANRALLEEITELTDGRFYPADSGNEISKIYGELQRANNNYYVIKYKPSAAGGAQKVALKYYDLYEEQTLRGAYHPQNTDQKFKLKNAKDLTPQVVAYFNFNRSRIPDEYNKQIKTLAKYLKKRPDTKILVRGHTDTKGTGGYNLELALRRAHNVYKVFRKHGVSASRMKVMSVGEKQPINKMDDTKHRSAENRRVEIQLVNTFLPSDNCNFYLQYPKIKTKRKTIRFLDTLLNSNVEDVLVEMELHKNKRVGYRIRSGCYETLEKFMEQAQRAMQGLKLKSGPVVFDLKQ